MRRLLLLPLLLIACAEQGGPQDPAVGGRKGIRTPALRGEVVQQEDGLPYGPVLVALQEAKTRRVVDLQTTGPDGGFLFEDLEPGPYVPVVYDNAREVFHLDRSHFNARRGAIVEVTVEMAIDPDPLSATDLPLTGRVTDATTGDPIAGAIVETTSIQESSRTLFSELEGRSNLMTQPTGDDGRYTIEHMPAFTLNNIELVPHVRVSAPGYRSRAFGGWVRDLFPGVLNAQLEPGTDQGVIEGRLVHLRTGEPVSGVDVTVEWRNGGGTFPKTLLAGAIGTSDAEGRFRIEGLPQGGHLLNPAFPLDDGWSGEQMRVADVPQDGVVDVGTLGVVEAMQLVSPADDARVTGDLLLQWEPVPTAQVYVVLFRRAEDGARYEAGTTESAWKPTPEDTAEYFNPGGTYLWSVIAYSAPSFEAGRPERSRVFHWGKP